MKKSIFIILIQVITVTAVALTAHCGGVVADALCGNNTVEGTEECDDGDTNSGDGCSSTCKIEHPVCGNSVVEYGESCDDGNNADGLDGCDGVFCKVIGVTFINTHTAPIGVEIWSGTSLNYNSGKVEGANLYKEVANTTLDAAGGANDSLTSTVINSGDDLLIIIALQWPNTLFYYYMDRHESKYHRGRIYTFGSDGQLTYQDSPYR